MKDVFFRIKIFSVSQGLNFYVLAVYRTTYNQYILEHGVFMKVWGLLRLVEYFPNVLSHLIIVILINHFLDGYLTQMMYRVVNEKVLRESQEEMHKKMKMT